MHYHAQLKIRYLWMLQSSPLLQIGVLSLWKEYKDLGVSYLRIIDSNYSLFALPDPHKKNHYITMLGDTRTVTMGVLKDVHKGLEGDTGNHPW
jgi:hypothetical protein